MPRLRYLLTVAKTRHARLLTSITRRDIAELLSATAANVTRGTGEVTSNRLRSALSAMFTWAMKEGLAESNPVAGTNQRSEKAKRRVLSMAELVEVWRALPDTTFGAIVKLLILTGQRRTEIGGLRWDELDEEFTRILLPGRRTKNKLEHIVPLSSPARDILSRHYQIVGQAGVFGKSDRGFANWGRCQAGARPEPVRSP
jgi:integrase